MITEQEKERIVRNQDAVAGMKVWRRRLDTDDGYEFQASVKRPGKDWHAATHQQITEIACRALTGSY